MTWSGAAGGPLGAGVKAGEGAACGPLTLHGDPDSEKQGLWESTWWRKGVSRMFPGQTLCGSEPGWDGAASWAGTETERRAGVRGEGLLFCLIPLFLFRRQKGVRGRHRQRSAVALDWARLKPGARNSIRVSHTRDRSPRT